MSQHTKPTEHAARHASPCSTSDSSESEVDESSIFDHEAFLAQQELSTILERLTNDNGPTGLELRVADDEGDENLPALDPEQWTAAFDAWIDENGLQRYREHLRQLVEERMQANGSDEERQETDGEEMSEAVAVDDDDENIYDAD